MSNNVMVPYKNSYQIEKIVNDFIKKYHPENTYPTPIEEIIEFKFNIDIIPISGLHKIIDTDGFLSSDLRSISVEEYVYKNRASRYRFTLAHEIAHFVMHKHIYEQYRFNNLSEWRKFVENFPEKEWSWLEWQANEFAGIVLVPTHHLRGRLKYHNNYIESIGIKNKDVELDRIIELLSKDFIVSKEVIQRRLLHFLKNIARK